jgi:hypothetical protein
MNQNYGLLANTTSKHASQVEILFLIFLIFFLKREATYGMGYDKEPTRTEKPY